MARLETRLIARKQVAEGTMSFFFDKPRNFEYEAGQHVTLELPKGGSHMFTLSSAPYEDRLMITTRMRDSTFKHALEQLEDGAEVGIRGPEGSFTLPSEQGTEVFIAGGIGITPFRSMLLEAGHDKRTDNITLFYSNRRPEDAAFLAELERLCSKSGYRLVAAMTEMQDSDRQWDGETGHIDAAMLQRHLEDLSEPTFYLAGPPDMVDDMKDKLIEAKIDKSRIEAEEFSGY